MQCLEEFDPGVKESAAWALGYIAGHNADLAATVVEAGAVPLLVLCVQEPELSLKRIAASSLSDIAKHTPEMAQAVVDAGAVGTAHPLTTHTLFTPRHTLTTTRAPPSLDNTVSIPLTAQTSARTVHEQRARLVLRLYFSFHKITKGARLLEVDESNGEKENRGLECYG